MSACWAGEVPGCEHQLVFGQEGQRTGNGSQFRNRPGDSRGVHHPEPASAIQEALVLPLDERDELLRRAKRNDTQSRVFFIPRSFLQMKLHPVNSAEGVGPINERSVVTQLPARRAWCNAKAVQPLVGGTTGVSQHSAALGQFYLVFKVSQGLDRRRKTATEFSSCSLHPSQYQGFNAFFMVGDACGGGRKKAPCFTFNGANYLREALDLAVLWKCGWIDIGDHELCERESFTVAECK